MTDFIRRVVDIIVSLMALILLSPILIVIALLVYFTSHGGCLYRSQRVGKNGKLFTLYKFRSMIPDADKKGSFSVSNKDSRVTTIGQILRTTKLDEFPQLFNVLIGDMSLVGPRPDIPQIMEQNSEKVKKIILSIKPGLSDWSSLFIFEQYKLYAQVTDPDDFLLSYVQPIKLALQEYYCQNRTLAMDYKICMYTILRMVKIKLALPQEVHNIVNQFTLPLSTK
jgi:lipopolysaccharide/colanic/teichoic acid biosynthesis glycosyltransferase